MSCQPPHEDADMVAGTATKFNGGGNDTFANIENLRGNNGSDILDGDEGFSDTASWFEQTQGQTFNLNGADSTVFSADGVDTDTIRQIERINGSNQGDTVNFFDTFKADDNNFLLFRLGEGDDTVNNNGGSLRIDYRFADAGITVDFGARIATGTDSGDIANIGTDTLNGVRRVEGTNFDDIFRGSDSGSTFEEFIGEAGNDTIDGVGGTNNTARYSSSPSGVNVNLTTGIAQDGFGGTDTLANIQHIRASRHNDTLTGNDQNNFFRPLGGDDIIVGGGGFDTGDYRFDSSDPITFVMSTTITAIGASIGTDTFTDIDRFKGGRASDTFTADTDYDNLNPLIDGLGRLFNAFEGREGDDVINGNGQTRIEYLGATGAVTVDLIAGTAIGDDSVGTDTFSGISSIVGGAFDDILRGSDVTTRSDGTERVEFFRGGEGDDLIDGRGGFDLVSYDFSNNLVGIFADLATGQITDGFGDNDTLISIEGIGGSDLVDTLFGDNGDNIFRPLGGDDTIDGRGGFDTVTYDGQPGALTVNLAAGTADDGEGGTDTLISIENVNGGIFDDALTGNSADNELRGNGGDDNLLGVAGSNELNGGEGADILRGGGDQDLASYRFDPTAVSGIRSYETD